MRKGIGRLNSVYGRDYRKSDLKKVYNILH